MDANFADSYAIKPADDLLQFMSSHILHQNEGRSKLFRSGYLLLDLQLAELKTNQRNTMPPFSN